MKISKKITSLLLALSILAIGAQAGFAEEGHGKEGKVKKSMEEMFFQKVKMIYMNQEELGVTDEQLGKIKAIKMGLKKDLIMKNADIEVAEINVKEKMMADPLDLDAVNALIDAKYALKTEKAKMIAAACASMRTILTAKQKDAMKKMMKPEHGKEKECGCGKRGMGGMKH